MGSPIAKASPRIARRRLEDELKAKLHVPRVQRASGFAKFAVRDLIVSATPGSCEDEVSPVEYVETCCFKLHIEFRYPKGSNSGVYLRGRYEVQIEDSKGMEPLNDQLSSIYGFLSPSEMLAKNAGEWQSYDITLVGRMVTVVFNGKKVICSQEIPGITGGALDSREGEPGPIYLQGDHGPIEYRNIRIATAK